MMNMWGMFKATISDSFNDHLRSLVSRLKKKGRYQNKQKHVQKF